RNRNRSLSDPASAPALSSRYGPAKSKTETEHEHEHEKAKTGCPSPHPAPGTNGEGENEWSLAFVEVRWQESRLSPCWRPARRPPGRRMRHGARRTWATRPPPAPPMWTTASGR